MNRENIKVVTVGSASNVKGGITSVITQIMSHDWQKENVAMSFVPTFAGGNAVNKVFDFMKGYAVLLGNMLFSKPDVLHIHMSHNGSFSRKFIVHKMAKFFGVADVIHLHSSGFVQFFESASAKKKKRITALLTECSAVVALGDEWEQRVKRIAPKANIVVMNNTVAVPNEISDQDTEKVAFLYLGVLVKRKGVIDLLKAIDRLNEEKFFSTHAAVFNIGGTGDCENELKAFVNEHGLNHLVKFLGWVAGDEKKEKLKHNQVFVLPSYNEGLPIAILEAISYGMPVISTDVGSVAEAVRPANGYLYQAGDIDSLYRAIKDILQDKEKRLSMAKASRQLAEDVFDDRKYFSGLLNLYKAVTVKEKK